MGQEGLDWVVVLLQQVIGET